LLAAPASADVLARLDPGVAGPVTTPARTYFGAGFQLGGTVGVDVLRLLEIGGRVSYVFLSRNPTSSLDGPGSVLSVGPTARVHRPWDAGRYLPWLEASVQYARTGNLDRVGLQLSGGCHFSLLDHALLLGPWLGLTQVFHLADTATYSTHDTTILAGGVAVELPVWPWGGERAAPKPAVVAAVDPDPDHDGILGAADRCPNEPEDKDGFQDDDGCPDLDDDADGVPDKDDACPRLFGSATTFGCPDSDSDGVADTDDQCPTVKGVATEHGCPEYEDIRIREPRIELYGKVLFAPGRGALATQTSALLDQVVQALTDRPGMCIEVEARADKAPLATARAEAVRTYLMTHGVSPSRVVTKGVGGGPAETTLGMSIIACEVRTP
jgi:outer membrane protein OmpA-like peptidoglycan-associated protein